MMTLITGFTCPPTIYFKFITKCDKCYEKVRQVLQSVTLLLQNATGIPNATIITKCDRTTYKPHSQISHTPSFGQKILSFFFFNVSALRERKAQMHFEFNDHIGNLTGGCFYCCQEPMSRKMQLSYNAYITAFLQTGLFLVQLFFCEREAVPVQ